MTYTVRGKGTGLDHEERANLEKHNCLLSASEWICSLYLRG